MKPKTGTQHTAAELEASKCTKLAFTRNPSKDIIKQQFWDGMNERDELDECSHLPVGRGLTAGFRMMNPDYDGADV
jgi:hypothetical protein